MQANSIRAEEELMNELLEEYANAMVGEGNIVNGETPEEPENPTIAVESVSLDKTNETLAQNGTMQLTAKVNPSEATNKNVTWSSGNTSIATVDQTGLVTAVGAGSTTITVKTTDGRKTASCNLTVVKPLTSTVTSTNHTGTATEDTLGNPVYVPGGFKIAEDSGSTVKEGIVIEGTSGNQFVWVPVSNINGDGSNKIRIDETNSVEITLGRYTFATSSLGTPTIVQKGSDWDKTTSAINEKYKIASSYNSSYYHYELATKMSGKNEVARNLQSFVESVRDNHGYYLARYEASYASGSSIADYKPASKVSTSKSTSSMSYTVGTLWNRISQGDASKVCQNMYSGHRYVESDLVNSYAWDTAIVYIQAMGNSNYANQGRGSNTSLLNTGDTGDQKCKIFDMAGNVREWTTEYCTYNEYPCTYSGGDCGSNFNYVAYRNYDDVGSNSSVFGFRPLLYVK